MLNPFTQARFMMSCAKLPQLPSDHHPEIAFAGRSNAGKSSALNALCGKRALARVSKTPGRTQLINLFELADGRRLADLPGYGYAHVPVPVRLSWGQLIGGYVETRRNLQGIVLIMDVRHPLTDYDKQMLAWTISAQRPCHILLTKADKLGYGASKTQLLTTQKGLAELGSQASVQLFSSATHQGVDEAREKIYRLLKGDADPVIAAAEPPAE